MEFAFALPIFLILVFGIIDFSLGLRAWISITNSAREGARWGAIRGSCDAIINQVKQTSGGLITEETLKAGDATITIDPEDCDGTAGDPVIVTVSYEYDLITPLGGALSLFGSGIGLPRSIEIESTSNMRVE